MNHSINTVTTDPNIPQTKPLNPVEKFVNNSSSSLVLAGTFILLFGAVALFFIMQPYFEEVHLDRMNTIWGQAIMIMGFTLLTIKLAFIGYILTLYFKDIY